MLRCLSSRLISLVFSMVLTVAASSARADDCSNEKSLKSTASTTQSEISFQNRSSDKRRIYWIDQDGDRKFYGIVEPGNVFKQRNRENHAWVGSDDAEKCLYSFIASAKPRPVNVGEAAADVTAPPPGGQQPIAQPPVAPPPVVVQAPPPVDPPPAVVQSPPTAPPAPVAPAPVAPAPAPVMAAPAPAAAPPLDDPPSAMAEIPQISPIEQFDLRGLFRISPRTNPSIAVNSEAAGTIFVMNVKPEWDQRTVGIRGRCRACPLCGSGMSGRGLTSPTSEASCVRCQPRPTPTKRTGRSSRWTARHSCNSAIARPIAF